MKSRIALLTLLAAASAHGATGDIPPALLGEAGPPGGESLNYHGEARGYLALPEGAGPHGSVMLIHEWNGLVDRVRQVADAFAAEGYVALAADLYGGRTGSNPQENIALVRETLAQPDAIVANLDAAATYLKQRPDTTGKIAAIGWCYGGGVALSYALGSEHHDATAIFYGRLLDDPERLAQIRHEVYGTFAGQDAGIPPEAVERFVEALRAVGVENDVHIYDPVKHGFWLYVDRDPEVNREPAADAWRRLKAYLQRTLG